MKIKTKMYFILIVAIGLGLTIVLSMAHLTRQVDRATHRKELANEVVRGMFELSLLVSDYLLQQSKRAQTQWQARHESIAKLFVQEAFQSRPFAAERVRELHRRHERMRSLFSKLVINERKGRDPDQDLVVIEEFSKRLIGLMAIVQHAIVRDAFNLAEVSRQEAATAQQRLRLFIVVAVSILVGLIALILWVIQQSIVQPVRRLHKGTEVVGSGNLDYRVSTRARDEIGQLSRAFDQMVDHLKSVMASRDELNDVLRQLKGQQQALDSFAIVAETDPQGNMIYVNDQFCLVSKYGRHELIGQNQRIVSSGHHSKEFWKIFWGTIKAGLVWRGDIKNRAKDGSIYWVDTTIVPFLGKDGTPEKYLAIRAVITDRKKTEEILNQRTEELARSNQDLEQFAYAASHDLQEPLRKIVSFSNLVERENKDKLDANSRENLQYVVEGGKRLQGLVKDLLAFSRLASGPLKRMEINVRELVRHVLVDLERLIRQTKAQITYDELPTVMASKLLMYQLFQNLIANGIKYRGNQPPHVHITAGRDNGEHLFTVKDNGIGFDPQYANRIFEIFQRLHTRKEYSGSGIGLALCKKIVERFGGRIWAESAPGQGSQFHFTIPE